MDTHIPNIEAIATTASETRPAINGTLLLLRKPSTRDAPCGSGSTKFSFRPTISEVLGGLPAL